MIKISILLLAVNLALSHSSSAFAEPNATLLCIGEYSNFRDKQLGIKLDSILVSISDTAINIRDTPTFSSGDNGTNYVISKVTDLHFRFSIAGNSLIQGSLNRYSGKLSLLWLKGEKLTEGLNASVSADCQPARRKF